VPSDKRVEELAATLQANVALLMLRMRQVSDDGGLSVPERSALKSLDRAGPTTVTALARAEDMRVQSMGATVAGLRSRGLVETRHDPDDGRRTILAITQTGREALADKGDDRIERMTEALSAEFTEPELRQLIGIVPLIDRLAGEV
jgi:DNA-binding MarR family transcriptional regulator